MSETSFTEGPWIVGQPGGPAGPFWSIMNQKGNVVALQVLREEDARLIRTTPDLLMLCNELLARLERADPGRESDLRNYARRVLARATVAGPEAISDAVYLDPLNIFTFWLRSALPPAQWISLVTEAEIARRQLGAGDEVAQVLTRFLQDVMAWQSAESNGRHGKDG